MCLSTCPIIVVTDNEEMRVFMPEFTGRHSASFLKLVDAGTFSQSTLPRLRQGNVRCTALDDIIDATLHYMFTQRMQRSNTGKLSVLPDSERVICKYINADEFNMFSFLHGNEITRN